VRARPALLLIALLAARTAQAEPEPEPERRVWLALRSASAFGYSGAGFYNHLAGARLDYRPDPRFAIGVLASYANLKGAEGRAHNVLVAGMVEYRLPLSARIALPVRGYTGYLPANGPWLEAATGLRFGLGPTTELTLELVAPALWVIRERVVGSFDAAIELAFRL
jgi:hypothetical protein